MAAAGNALLLLLAVLWLVCLLPRHLEAAVVLQYHHVSDQTPPSTSVTPSRFAMHLDYIANQGFEVLPLQALVDALLGGETLPDRVVAITFDDGYSSVYSEAFPRLAERGWPFTVFVNTEPHDRGRRGFMSWDQLREMSRRGGTIANHTISHPHLLERGSGEDEPAWRTRVTAEITGAQHRIEQEIGAAPPLLAYPFGEYDRAVLEIAAALGFTGFGQQSGPLAPYSDPRALPRFPFGGPYGDPGDFATKIDSLPLPLDTTDTPIRWETADGLPLADLVLNGPAPLPVLVLAFPKSFDPRGLSCFATGQGPISIRLENHLARVAANQPLRPGRSRYNCTARSPEAGRHYWFSQPWLYLEPDSEAGTGHGPVLFNLQGESP
jgi:peptidoglycan/xylan/chitin deacetylase (PgdA/CDA1 family)